MPPHLVRDAVIGVTGSLRVLDSGSLAPDGELPHHRRDQGLDADCGVVLDRRRYTELGPDGNGAGPGDIVEEMRNEVAGKVRVIPGNDVTRVRTELRHLWPNSPNRREHLFPRTPTRT